MQELADGLYPFAVAAAFGSGWVERGGLLFQDSGDAFCVRDTIIIN
jgi:hypothetical protein